MENLRTDLRNTNLPSADRVGMLASLAQVNDPQLPAMLWELMKDNALRADVIRYLARYQQPETPRCCWRDTRPTPLWRNSVL